MEEIYDAESKGIRASGYEKSNNDFLIRKGSLAVSDKDIVSSFSEKPNRIEIRKKLIEDGKLIPTDDHYYFSEDVSFNSPSEAASIVWGSNLNGRKVFGINSAHSKTHKLFFEIDSQKAIEGHQIDIKLKQSIRNRKLIVQRKRKDEYTCQVCGYFKKIEGKFIIECHHLKPIFIGQRETSIGDLISLCPTCHRIIHTRNPIYSIPELKELLAT